MSHHRIRAWNALYLHYGNINWDAPPQDYGVAFRSYEYQSIQFYEVNLRAALLKPADLFEHITPDNYS